MAKEFISLKQGITIMVMFIIGSTLVIGGGSEVKQDAWIAILLGILMALPALFIYVRLILLFPGKTLFDINELVFGKFIGKFITFLYTWYVFHLGSLVIRNFSEFIEVVSLPETPQTIIVICMGLIIIYMVKSGIEVLGRWTEFIMPGLVLVVVSSFFLSVPNMKFENIKPVLYNGLIPVLGSAFSLFAFPFAETVIFMIIFSSLKPKASPLKVYYLSLIIGGSLILSASIKDILVLGFPTASTLYFPSYATVNIINIGDFFQRLEVIVSVSFLLCGIVKISVCLMAASKGVAKILNLDDYKMIIAPICLLMLNLSCFIYSSTMEMFEWEKIYRYYAIPFQIILPLITYIGAEIKQKKSAQHV